MGGGTVSGGLGMEGRGRRGLQERANQNQGCIEKCLREIYYFVSLLKTHFKGRFEWGHLALVDNASSRQLKLVNRNPSTIQNTFLRDVGEDGS